MRQQFWSRWSCEYISRLQQRPKWLKQRVVPKVGDLVIIKDDRLPPQQWRLGRITSLYHGDDGFPRVADLKTSDGEIRRPIVKLSLLPIETSPCSTEDVI
jgi:signal peptidase I